MGPTLVIDAGPPSAAVDAAAVVVSARDLSQPGWCFDPARPMESTLVAGGRPVPLQEVERIEVRSRLVHPSTLRWIAEDDREYAAAEMTAVLEAYLALFGGPVDGRPAEPAPLQPVSRRRPGTGRPLLLGCAADRPMVQVCEALHATGCVPILLDDAAASAGVRVDDGGVLHHRGGTVPLADVSSAYLRPASQLGPVQLPLLQWADTMSGTVVNRPAAAFVNNSKPRQLHAIAACGFDVPETLVTTSPDAARRFAERHGRVVFKSASGVRSIATELSHRDLDRLAQVAACPTMFQRLVAGVDVRAHVVGAEVFAARIESDSLDYRYAGRMHMEATALDSGVEDRLVAMVRHMGLHVAGVDLRLTPEGRWVCLEVNPSPGFTWFSGRTGQPIAEAIAALLAAAA